MKAGSSADQARVAQREGETKPTEPNKRTTLLKRSVGIAAVLGLALVLTPVPPAPTTTELDPSLGAVLSYAQAHHLQFGPELLSTYGPLGFLIFPYFYPDYGFARLAVNFAISLVAAAGLWRFASRLQIPARIAMLVLFAWGAATVYPRADLVLNAGLLSWTLLCLATAERRPGLDLLALVILGAFSALAKTYFLITATTLICIVALAVWLQRPGTKARRWKGPITVVAAYLGTLLMGWLLAGQRMSHLGTWISEACTLVRGYTEALGWERPWLTPLGFKMLALLALACLLRAFAVGRALFLDIRKKGQTPNNGPGEPGTTCGETLKEHALAALGLAAIAFVSFASWRHSFVRADYLHSMMFLAFMPVLAFALQLSEVKGHWQSKLLTGAVWTNSVVAMLVLQLKFFPEGAASALQPFRNAMYHVTCLADPSKYHERMSETLAQVQTAAQLPALRKIIGPATVDVFGQRQLDALDNDLAFHPRPVFQSHGACNRELMRLNEAFFMSHAAPEFVLFELDPIDSKLPPLEDALTLRHLLINYEPVGAEGRFLLLKQHSTEPAQLTLLTQATARPGERIELPGADATNLWLEVELRPTLLGRLRQFFFQPPVVRIAAWRGPGKQLIRRQRAPPAMLGAGFLARPLLLHTSDVADVFDGRNLDNPASYSVELNPGSERFWQPGFTYRLYRIENRLGTRLLPSKAKTSFHIFRNPRWRPTRPPLGGLGEQLAFALMAGAPLLLGGLLLKLGKAIQTRRLRPSWYALLGGNALVFSFLASVALFGGEIWFRFFYDTTDALGYTKVCERWVERHWQINNFGCRDNTNYSLARSPGRRRITFIGDSFTAGHGIKNVEDRFANQVRKDHPEWEIHVVANVGLDTGGERAVLDRLESAGYEWGDVVLVYCLNDIGDLLPKESLAFEQTFSALDNANWLVRNSYCLNFVLSRVKAATNKQSRDYFGYVREAYRGPVWSQQQERLKGIRDAVRARGGRLFVVTFPFLHKLGNDYPYAFVHDQLRNLWRELDVPSLDLWPIYRSLTPAEVTVNRYDAHPNERASALAAGAIDEFLLLEQRLPKRHPSDSEITPKLATAAEVTHRRDGTLASHRILVNTKPNMAQEKLDTAQKARQINLDANRYGTFAEIGAGQEVARWFFRVGGAAKTVAKTISAYDMSVSDAIYGPTERYVSRRRLKAMLDYEYELLLERLNQKRGGTTAFFVFANTVTTRKEEGHGWLGIKFQDVPGADPSEIYIHLRMLDKENFRQQEALGVIGVNLVHATFYSHETPDQLIRSLLDDLTWERVEVDMIRLAGPAFAKVDNRLLALQLVREGLTEAAMFTAQGEAAQWAEVLYEKPVLVERGSFRPMTKATLDVLERGLEQFIAAPELNGEAPVVLLEMTLRHLTTGDVIDPTDFIHRADTLSALGRNVLVSNFRRFHRFASYLSRYTKRPIGIPLGASVLKEIFDESFYNESEGGLLGGLGQLFKNSNRLYVYPHLDLNSGELITAQNYRVTPHLKHLYAHLLENGSIRPITRYEPRFVPIRRREVLGKIQSGDGGWEELVPPPIAEVIKKDRLFGYKEAVLEAKA